MDFNVRNYDDYSLHLQAQLFFLGLLCHPSTLLPDVIITEIIDISINNEIILFKFFPFTYKLKIFFNFTSYALSLVKQKFPLKHLSQLFSAQI